MGNSITGKMVVMAVVRLEGIGRAAVDDGGLW